MCQEPGPRPLRSVARRAQSAWVAHDTLAPAKTSIGPAAAVCSLHFDVSGVVQGVGFRPFVHRLAAEEGLVGVVGNDSTRVFIEVTGPAVRIEEFARRLVTETPPLARIESVTRFALPPLSAMDFQIVESAEIDGERTLIPPDTGVCADCLRELADPADRRHRHAFITCTNCGPRFTIIRDLPYDRPATTMAGFEMCETCALEYADPSDRRYHAQPIACPSCGPTLEFIEQGIIEHGARGTRLDPIEAAVDALRTGAIVAVKGLGGFHLACDAADSAAVGRLRRRKHRPDKPFAVMVPDLATASALAEIDAVEGEQLLSPARPIVLLRSRPGPSVSDAVAPGSPLIGIMLPSTPIHHLLFAAGAPTLVMTSGNLSGEPLAFRDADAAARLGGLCDAWLTHDRPIHVPCDDSVVRSVDKTLLPIRRARGFAPLPMSVDGINRNVLAVGGELKNSFCLASPHHAWMGQHLGNMENMATLDAFERGVEQFEHIYGIEPDVVAVDLHPGYRTSRWAKRHHDGSIEGVQHHHAHIASVMAEHGCDPDEPVIGFAFDGTGYGEDGSIWGGEVLMADANAFERVAHLAPIDLPGGDSAVRSPCRVALAHLASAGVEWTGDLAPVRALTPSELTVLRRQLDSSFGCVQTTSMGRLFDAVASLLDLRQQISYEAQAAIELEVLADRASGHSRCRYRFTVEGPLVSPDLVLRAIVDDLRAGVPVGEIALAFHEAVADVVLTLARRLRDERRTHVVAMSGGVFQNALLTVMCSSRLRSDGFLALTHYLVPPNDGGLALGQAFVAGHRHSARPAVGVEA